MQALAIYFTYGLQCYMPITILTNEYVFPALEENICKGSLYQWDLIVRFSVSLATCTKISLFKTRSRGRQYRANDDFTSRGDTSPFPSALSPFHIFKVNSGKFDRLQRIESLPSRAGNFAKSINRSDCSPSRTQILRKFRNLLSQNLV